MNMDLDELTDALARIAVEAGDVIMTIYARDFSVAEKKIDHRSLKRTEPQRK